MVRPNLMKQRTTMNIVFDTEQLAEFEKLVGKGNISREIRAMINDQIETRKKDEALQNSDYLQEPQITEDIPKLNKYSDFNKCLCVILNDVRNLRMTTDNRVNLYHLGKNLREESDITFTKRRDINSKIKYEESIKKGVSF